MADSEFQRPTLAENISMLRNDLFARLDVSDTLRRMDEDVRAKVYAAALHTVYGYIDYLAMNMLPDLCDESWLARHAAMKRCPRKGATAASGYMRWEGVSDGLKVTAGSVIQRDDLVQYTTTDDATSSGGVLRVPIACSSAGAVGNADDGTALILVTPVNGLPSSGVADTLTGGFDTEELETWRARVIERYYWTPQGGADGDYVVWAKEVPGIMAAFASSLSSTGFQKLPSGLIIQWGIVSGASNYTVTYPVTFPNRSLALLAVPHTTSLAGISAMGIANCSDITKSQFYIIVGGISQGEIVKYERSCFWVAIGV
ncbi:baseplate J/gp47 family protein [Escherichia coli]|uniref:baseplate J/gp47 family protein n=2 Tax=Escherichia coli TaxID=562 RepID=UPI000F6F2139|nr:baseplate J/gp47 family protein [Escherichia coli]VDZ01032.1 putative phage baseplate protein [Escherichia coli]HAI2367134.1 baseplate J/gp47 family protein [Escherichia coli]